MDDETVERILLQMEKKFGEYRMEQGAKFTSYGKILIDRYMTGQSKGIVHNQDQTISVRQYHREKATTKQRVVLYKGMKKEYGENTE
jgi:hypothetical protein